MMRCASSCAGSRRSIRAGATASPGGRPRGGLGREPQEDPAPVARGRPTGAASETQAATARQVHRARQAAAGRAPQPCLGLGLPVRHHQRRPHAETAPRRRRVHPRGAGDAGGPLDRADHTTRVLDQIVRERGAGPEVVRMDNGPEMTANALRDWCRFSGAERSFIEPGSPWQNPFVESFGSRVRDEVLSVEAFDSVLEAQTVITDWRTIYNHRRPHSSLGWRPPAAYAASLTTNKSEKPARLS